MRRLMPIGIVGLLVLLGVTLGGASTVDARLSTSSARCGWKPVPAPPIPNANPTAVVASAADDVWIVGYEGWLAAGMIGDLPLFSPARPLVLHYDGHTLEAMPAPSPFPKGSWLNDVVALGPKDVWAIGAGLARTKPVNHYVPLALHFNGESWRRVSMPTVASKFGAELYGVAGLAGNDVWAVGHAYDDRKGKWTGFIEHWNGRAWRIVASPRSTYRTVTALSQNDVWAAGSPPAHWGGRSWKLVKDTSPGSAAYAYASSASDPKNLWIVGTEAAGPFVERFDGRRFVRVPVPNAHWKSNYENEEDSHLTGVAAISPRNVWAVGNFGIEHYDGRHWKLVSRDSSYVGIAAVSPTDIWAVGFNLTVADVGGPQVLAKVLRYTCTEAR